MPHIRIKTYHYMNEMLSFHLLHETEQLVVPGVFGFTVEQKPLDAPLTRLIVRMRATGSIAVRIRIHEHYTLESAVTALGEMLEANGLPEAPDELAAHLLRFHNDLATTWHQDIQ